MSRYGYSKYRARRVTYDDIEFDSVAEGNRYLVLKDMLKKGEISDLMLQTKFVLIPSQKKDGKVIERECSYYADFTYMQDGKMVVEDVKGMKTPEYIIKRKLMLEKFGIQIKEVK